MWSALSVGILRDAKHDDVSVHIGDYRKASASVDSTGSLTISAESFPKDSTPTHISTRSPTHHALCRKLTRVGLKTVIPSPLSPLPLPPSEQSPALSAPPRNVFVDIFLAIWPNVLRPN